MDNFIACTLKELPDSDQQAAANTAVKVNPTNRPRMDSTLAPEYPSPQRLALLTTKWWGAAGVKLTVGFDQAFDSATRTKILQHANAWGAFCNVTFTPAAGATAQVRVARMAGGGYWSYLGTDITHIPSGQPTMNLEGFSASQTPDSEFFRVVRHEFGHTLGFPHEHMRQEIVADLDLTKTVTYFWQTQRWDADTVKAQVLTPIDQRSLFHPEWSPSDPDSIMCYQLPASITKSGKPIPGGSDIEANDRAFASKVYPPVVPPPPVSAEPATVVVYDTAGKVMWTFKRA